MSIAYTHPQTDYITDLITRFLRKVEGSIPAPYYDKAPQKPNSQVDYQNVTIGDGINIDWSNALHLRLVLAKLGLVESSTLKEANRRAAAGLPAETLAEKTRRLDKMVSAFQEEMRKNRPAEGQVDVRANNQQLQIALNNLSTSYGGGTFKLDDAGTQSEAIIRQIIGGNVSIPGFLNYPTSAGKQARLDVIIGSGLAHDTKEYEAVMSLFYNAETLVGDKLVRAITKGDRAEAWYQIRFGSNSAGWEEIDNHLAPNTKLGAGLAKRRYEEAQLFGLYGYTSQPGYDALKDAKDAYRMLQLHREKIFEYEAKYGEKPAPNPPSWMPAATAPYSAAAATAHWRAMQPATTPSTCTAATTPSTSPTAAMQSMRRRAQATTP